MQIQPQKKNVPIQQVLTALLDEQTIFPPAYLRRFSDLEGADLAALRSVWPQVHASRRLALLEDLETLAEIDTLVLFDSVAILALDDTDPRVRVVAIRLLSESEDVHLARAFVDMLEKDADVRVRAAAASALGRYVYLGELEEIPEDAYHTAAETLLRVLNGKDDPIVRRRALESIGFSSRPEVPDILRDTYTFAANADDEEWLASVLFAMNHSADAVWAPEVLRMLRYPKVDVQIEAVRAAGELELDQARRALLDMLDEEAQDTDVRDAAIWSLSQIGGEEIRETLEQMLEETEDEDEIEYLESALDNLSFTEDVGLYGLFGFDPASAEMKEEDPDYNPDIDGLAQDQEDLNDGSSTPSTKNRPTSKKKPKD